MVGKLARFVLAAIALVGSNAWAAVSATGGTTNDVGIYRIHTFTSNGALTVTDGGDIDVLVVAGGGGVGSKDNFKLIFDLAGAIGGAVGASRAAIDGGYIGKEYQIKANVAGPVRIARMTYQQATQGLQEYFSFFALINLVLMVMNLLPIPILDGGHIVISVIESLIRRPIPEKILIPVFNVFFFLLIALAIVVTFNDVINIWF